MVYAKSFEMHTTSNNNRTAERQCGDNLRVIGKIG